jgi:hypothetical protein
MHEQTIYKKNINEVKNMAKLAEIQNEVSAVIGRSFLVLIGGYMMSIVYDQLGFNESSAFYVDIASQWSTIIGIIFVVLIISVLGMAFSKIGGGGNGGNNNIF